MRSPEKNDVNIQKLFNWKKEFKLALFDGTEVILYIKLIGDADLNRARVFALRKSAELRNKLRTKDSDERLAFIQPPETIDEEKLIEIVAMLTLREITQQAYKEIKVPFPKEPSSNATTEELEEYQKEVDEYPGKREKVVKEFITNKVEEKRNELKNLPKDKLYLVYEFVLINELCEQEVLKRFKEYCAYLGLFKNKEYKELLFDSFEEFDNLPKETKDLFIDTYDSIDIGMDELKK